MKRIAVLGGTGMAGHVVVTHLSECGYDVHYTSRSAPESPRSKQINASDISSLSAWLEYVKPNVIINCMGMLISKSDARPDLAIMINSYIPRHLEHLYSNSGTKIIHLSTDCVFSGKRGGYHETDTPDGETVYDRTKALGEIVNDKDLTFRMSILGPDSNPNGTGLFNWFMRQTGDIKGFTKAIWNGVTTIELAQAIDSAIKQDLTGLYHLTPKEAIDKYNLILLFKKVFEKTNVTVEPYDGYVADKTLVNNRTDFNFSIKTYPQQVEEMQKWIKQHKSLYSHYLNSNVILHECI